MILALLKEWNAAFFLSGILVLFAVCPSVALAVSVPNSTYTVGEVITATCNTPERVLDSSLSDSLQLYDVTVNGDSEGINMGTFACDSSDVASVSFEGISGHQYSLLEITPYGQCGDQYHDGCQGQDFFVGEATFSIGSVSVANSSIGNVVTLEDITEAKVMERSRDEFFAVASHELRTPLTAIRGNADMILEMYADKITDKDMKEMIQDIDASSIRLINVVNDFLEVSRLEQGKVELKKETFSVTDVVDKVIRVLRTIVEAKGLSLTFTKPAQPLPNVYADKNRIEQILINLVGNANKFTHEGSIVISAEQREGAIKVRVTDTGAGISEHNQTLLFRKFQQAGEDMLARDVSQSTGLGLYICRLIVSAMGGQIDLEKSELGKGSVFYFSVPIASPAELAVSLKVTKK